MQRIRQYFVSLVRILEGHKELVAVYEHRESRVDSLAHHLRIHVIQYLIGSNHLIQRFQNLVRLAVP